MICTRMDVNRQMRAMHIAWADGACSMEHRWRFAMNAIQILDKIKIGRKSVILV